MSSTVPVDVPPRDREVPASWMRSPSIRAGLALRRRIVLLAADGVGTNEIVRRVGVSKPTVISWKRRYAVEGVGGLEDRPKAGSAAATGKVVDACYDRHRHQEFIRFLRQVAKAYPRRRLHVVVDNYGASANGRPTRLRQPRRPRRARYNAARS